MNENEDIKIADFGLARSFEDESYYSKEFVASTMAGTFKYMSPEIMDYKKYTYSTDVWSTGCVIFELITLEKYFDYSKNTTCDLKFDDINLRSLFFKKLLIRSGLYLFLF